MVVSNEAQVSIIHLYVTLALLAFICIAGGIGNFLVILVYRRKIHKNETAVFFILVLAISDLIVCLILVPCTMAVEYLSFKIPSLFCKSYYFLNTSNLIFSTMLISAVALDRYLCICHPLRQYLSVKGSIKLISAIALFSSVNGVISSFLVEIRPISDSKHESFESNGTDKLDTHFVETDLSNKSFICDEIKHFNNTSKIQLVFYDIFEKTNHIVYIVSIISVVILYSLIFRVIVRIRRGDTKREMILANSTNYETNETSLLPKNAEKPEIDVVDANNNNHDQSKCNIPTPKQRTRSMKSQKSYNKLKHDIRKSQKTIQRKQTKMTLLSNETFQNMRSAAMLFVVAVVYIIAFMPVLMIVNFKLIKFHLILYNLYYLNNAANPLIYCFMNSKFRQELMSILLRRPLPSDF